MTQKRPELYRRVLNDTRDIWLNSVCDSKVDQLQRSIHDDKICRLQVTVDDSCAAQTFWNSEKLPIVSETQHLKVNDLSWGYGLPTIFVDGLDGLQHVLPVQLPLQWIHSAAFLQPPVQIQVAALHQHVYIAAGYFTAKIFLTVTTFRLKRTMLRCHLFWSWDGNVAVLTSQTAWWFDRCAAASCSDV